MPSKAGYGSKLKQKKIIGCQQYKQFNRKRRIINLHSLTKVSCSVCIGELLYILSVLPKSF